jgi:hypothetical protein
MLCKSGPAIDLSGVSQTRFALAKQLPGNTGLPMSEIASALRFADAAVLFRSMATA